MKKRILVILVFVLSILLISTTTLCFADNPDNLDRSVRVGIIDSGVSKISENVLDGFNYLDNSTDTTDYKGHGSMIAGIILDIAPDAEIIPLKCTELNRITDNSSIIMAIYKAIDDFHCDVINISIGMPDSKELKTAVDYAVHNGAIVVAAAGNDGEISYKKGKVYYPAGYENVVGVGSVDEKGVVSGFSQRNKSVFIAALGESGKYAGTSFSAARISGAAAIAKSINKTINASLFMECLKAASVDCGDEGYDTSYGNGILDMEIYMKGEQLYE